MKELETHPFYLKTKKEIQKEIDSIARKSIKDVLEREYPFPSNLSNLDRAMIAVMLYDLFQSKVGSSSLKFSIGTMVNPKMDPLSVVLVALP